MYKVRFNLGRGINYMKWQVIHVGSLVGLKAFKSVVGYYDPADYQLIMYNCKLYNVPRVAEKIFSGSHKTVCAWVSCEDIDIAPVSFAVDTSGLKSISYNPKKLPYWTLENKNVDNKKYSCLLTFNNKVYLKNE